MIRIRAVNINTRDFWDDAWNREPAWREGFGIHPDRWGAVTSSLSPPAKVLDVGGGRGEFLEWIGNSYERTLLDHSQRGIELALANGRAEHGVVGDCSELPFDDDTFDATFCCEVIEHVEDPRLLIRELRRVTKSGGIVGISTPDRNTVDDRQHIWSFDIFDIKELFWGEPVISIQSGPTIVAVARV